MALYYDAILDERVRQRMKGKSETHTMGDWFLISDDYRGKAARAVFNGDKKEFTKRMIQHMAVLMACLEEYGDG